MCHLPLKHDALTHVDHPQHHLDPVHYLPPHYTLPTFPLDRVAQQMTSPLYLEPSSKIPVHIGLEEHRASFLAKKTLYLPW